ncbi:MAG: NfeD family protein [Thermoflexales bacterium]
MGDGCVPVDCVSVLRTDLSKDTGYMSTAHVAGELWTVKSDQAIRANTEVAVERVEGLSLIVRPYAAKQDVSQQ